jgi:Condensation domain
MYDEDLTVPFEAAAGGTFAMCWGQSAIWKPITWYGADSTYFTMQVVDDLPDGAVGTEAVVGVLRALVVEHEALRANFADGPTGPQQRIAARGTFAVRIRHSAPERSRADAEDLVLDLARAGFDHASQWAVRIGVVEADGFARHAVFALSHLAVDRGAIDVLLAQLHAAVEAARPADAGGPAGPAAAAGPARGREPSEQARFEQSEDGRRRNRAALDYWRRKLGGIPPTMFDVEPGPVHGLRFKTLSLDSVALSVAAEQVADAARVSTSSVLLTGTALALATLGGRTECALQLIVGNRHTPEQHAMVAAAAQNGLFAHDYRAQETFAQAVRATHRAGLEAHFHGHYDPLDLDREREQIAAQRGVSFDLTVYFNDTRGTQDRWDCAGVGRGEAEVRALLARTRVTAHEEWPLQDSKFFLHVTPDRDRCRLFLLADTAYLPLATMERVLRGIEALVVEAAYRDVALADVAGLTGLDPARSRPHGGFPTSHLD